MDIQGNEHTLFILLTTFFFHSPLSFCFSFFHVFSFLSISCIILKPSHIPFFSVSHLGHYWCHTLLYLLLWVIKLGFFNSYLHQQQNCTRNCIRTAISSLYSIYNALLNLPRLLLWQRNWSITTQSQLTFCRFSHSYSCDICQLFSGHH